MAQITIDVPDAQIPRVRAAFAKRLDIPVADVDVAEVKGALIDILKTIVRSSEQDEAARTAAQAVVDVDPT